MNQVGNGAQVAVREGFHLEGWKLLNVQSEDGYEVYTARLIEQPTSCPQCNSAGPLHKHGKRVVSYLDKPLNGKPCRIRGEAQRYRCAECLCSFAIDPRGMCRDKRMTGRVIEFIESVSMGENTFSEIAVYLGCNETTVRNIATQYAESYLSTYTPALPAKLGIGAMAIDSVNRLVLVDLEAALPLDILPSCDADGLRKWFAQLPSQERLEEVHVALGEGISGELLSVIPEGITVIVDASPLELLVEKGLSKLRIDERRNASTKSSRWLATQVLLTRRLSSHRAVSLERLKRFPLLYNGYLLKEMFLTANESKCRSTAAQTYDFMLSEAPSHVTPYFKEFFTYLKGFKAVIVKNPDAESAGQRISGVMSTILTINGRGRGYGLESLRARVLNNAYASLTFPGPSAVELNTFAAGAL